MKKWLLRIFGAILILMVIVVVGGRWLLKQAFGPLERIIEIPISDSQMLVCHETYNADFAATFYDVDFKLINNNKTIILGQATFSNDQWDKRIKLDSINDWYFLHFSEDSYLRLLIGHKATAIHVDTTLLPIYLKRDKAWRNDNRDIKTRQLISLNSKMEEVNPNFLKVNYGFLVEDTIRFKQSIIYNLDSLTGRLKTKSFLGKERVND